MSGFNSIVTSSFVASLLVQASSLHAAVDEVEKLKGTIGRLSVIAWTAQESVSIRRTPDGAASARQSLLTAAKAQEKWAMLVKDTGDTWLAGQLIPFSKCMEAIFNGKQAVHIAASDPKTRRVKLSNPALVTLPDDLQPEKSITVYGSLDNSPPLPDVPPVDYLHSGRFLFGFLGDDVYLPAVLSEGQANRDVSAEPLTDCVTISSRGRAGACTAWLDSKQGFLPRKVRMVKEGDDLLRGKPISQAQPSKGPKIWPNSRLRTYQQVVDNVSFQEFDGTPVIRQLTNTVTYSYEDGQQLVFKHDFVVKEFHHPAASEFSPTIKIPENAQVHVPSSPKISYVWRGGEIAAVTATEALQSLDGVTYANDHRGVVSYVLLGANIVVVIAVVLWIVRRRIYSR